MDGSVFYSLPQKFPLDHQSRCNPGSQQFFLIKTEINLSFIGILELSILQCTTHLLCLQQGGSKNTSSLSSYTSYFPLPVTTGLCQLRLECQQYSTCFSFKNIDTSLCAFYFLVHICPLFKSLFITCYGKFCGF